MKKQMLFLIAVVLVSFQGWAQKNDTKQVEIESKFVEVGDLYIRAQLGFAWGTHSEILNQTTTTSGNENTTVLTEAMKVRYGTGLPFGIGVGYMLTKNIGVELGIDYFNGFGTKIVNNNDGEEAKIVTSALHLSVVPSVVAKIEVGNVIPFIRMGLDVSVVNQVKTHMTGYTYLFKASSGKRSQRDYGGLTLGINAAAGVEFPLSKMISIFGEIQADQVSWSPKHGKVTKYEVEGEDMLSSLSTRQKQWDYVKSINSDDPTPSDEANKVLRITHSFDNVGLVVGVKINLGKKG